MLQQRVLLLRGVHHAAQLCALQPYADGIERAGAQADCIGAVGPVRAPLRQRVAVFAKAGDEQVARPAARIERELRLQAKIADQLIVGAPALAQMLAYQAVGIGYLAGVVEIRHIGGTQIAGLEHTLEAGDVGVVINGVGRLRVQRGPFRIEGLAVGQKLLRDQRGRPARFLDERAQRLDRLVQHGRCGHPVIVLGFAHVPVPILPRHLQEPCLLARNRLNHGDTETRRKPVRN